MRENQSVDSSMSPSIVNVNKLQISTQKVECFIFSANLSGRYKNYPYVDIDHAS